MLENFLVSLKAVFPLFAIMVCGMLVRKAGIVNDTDVKKFNKVVFAVCYPALMFENLYGNDLGEVFDLKLIIFAVAGIVFAYLLGMATAFTLTKNPKSRGALIQGIYRSNFVILGLPIVQNIYGKGSLGLTAMLLAVVIPIYNIAAVITLEVFRGGKPDTKKIIVSVIKNPLILGAIAAFLCIGLNITLPSFIDDTIEMINNATTPMALIVLGASFDLQSLKGSNKALVVAVLEKLVIIPGIVLSCACLIGIRDVALVTLIALFAAPTALASFTMAQAMDSDWELAGNIVIFTSMLSCFTMFLWLFVLRTLGMF